MSTTLKLYSNHGYPSLLGRSVFDDFFGAFFTDIPGHVKATTQGYPVADIYRNDDGSTTIECALAGFSRDEISIEVKPEKRSITIYGKVGSESPADGRRIARRAFERTYVNYDDNLNLAEAYAKYDNGLLTVTVPIRPEVKPLTIDIE